MEMDTLIRAYLANEESFESGEIVIEEGSKGDWVYVVLEGQFKVTKRTAAGMLTVDILKRGAIFGEMALFGKAFEARSASVVAADGPARVGVLDTRQLIDDYESLSPRIRLVIKALIMRLKESNEKAASLVVAASQRKRSR